MDSLGKKNMDDLLHVQEETGVGSESRSPTGRPAGWHSEDSIAPAELMSSPATPFE